MTDPVLTKSLARLRSDFNARFPGRDKTTDGWIGDWEHQQHTSGHNPDDTAGSLSEYTDADTIPEVRAIDVDKDLRDTKITMPMVIAGILKTPNDLKRLKYIIHNATIWTKSNGWVPKEYTGTNDHTEHAHFSGDPAYDEDTTAWSVLTIGVPVATWDQGDENVAWATTSRTEALLKNLDAADYQIAGEATKRHEVNGLKAQLARMEATLSELKDRPAGVVTVTADQVTQLATAVSNLVLDSLEQMIADRVRAELDATRLARG